MREIMTEKETMNKMGVFPIKRLILTMGIPMILSMMLQAFYNIVDSAFVSNIPGTGEAALNALTLAFPIQMLMVAVGIGTGVGANALLSKSLGQGNKERASLAAGNAVFLAGILYVIFCLFGVFGVKVYVASQTSNLEIAAMAVSYLRICCIISIGILFFSIYEKILQATGHTVFSTIAQVAGAATNMILDPVLIYGYFGFRAYGVEGAAYATVIGQMVAFVLAIIFHFKYNQEIENNIRFLKPSINIIRKIYAIGLPAIIAQALMSVMTYGLNVILVHVSEAAVTAYGLYYKIQQFILFAAFGLRDAITPIISFNHGLGSRTRVKDGIKYGIFYTLIIMLTGMIVLEVFAKPFAGIFGLSGETEKICIYAIRVISLSFLFAGVNIAFQGIFQALESGFASLIISICRQFIFVLPVAWGFSLVVGHQTDNIWLVWLTFLIAETISMLIAIGFMRKIKVQIIEQLS